MKGFVNLNYFLPERGKLQSSSADPLGKTDQTVQHAKSPLLPGTKKKYENKKKAYDSDQEQNRLENHAKKKTLYKKHYCTSQQSRDVYRHSDEPLCDYWSSRLTSSTILFFVNVVYLCKFPADRFCRDQGIDEYSDSYQCKGP